MQQPPNIFGSTMLGVFGPFAAGLTFDRFQTLRSQSQQHATTYNNI